MAFKPNKAQGNGQSSNINYEELNNQIFAQMEEGLTTAYIVGFIDNGTQERDPIKRDDGTYKDQRPAQQIFGYYEFPDVIIDWDKCMKDPDKEGQEKLGKKPYRHPIHRVFKGVPTGINFNPAPPMDNEGNIIKDRKWTFAATSIFTKLAKAANVKSIIDPDSEDNMDISLLVGKPLMVDVEIKEGKNGGQFLNVKNPVKLIKGAKAPKLTTDTFLIDMDTDDTEMVKKNMRFGDAKVVVKAPEFVGSPLQPVIKEVFDLDPDKALGSEDDDAQNSTQNQSQATPDSKAPEEAGKGGFDDFDDDIPF